MKRILTAAAFALALVFPLRAMTVWTGAVDNKLSTPGNWKPAGVPPLGEAVYFFLNGNTTVVNDLATRISPVYVTASGSAALHVTGNPWPGGTVQAYLGGSVFFDSGVSVTAGGVDLETDQPLFVSDLYAGGGTFINLAGPVIINKLNGSGQVVAFGMKLASDSSFTGSLQITGVAIIDVAMPSAAITVSDFGLLQGTGSFGNVNVQGSLDPGPNACLGFPCTGLVHTFGTQTFNHLSIGGSKAATFIDVNGSLCDVISANSVTLGGALTIYNPGAPVPGSVLKIIDNKGGAPVAGTFNGLPEGALVPAADGKTSYIVSYHGGDGNDVTLTERGHSTLALNATDIAPPASRVPVDIHVAWDGAAPNPPGSVSFTVNGLPGPTVALDAQGNARLDFDVQTGLSLLRATYSATGLYDGSAAETTIFGGKRTLTINTTKPDPVSYATPFAMTVTLAGASSPTGVLTINEGAAIVAATTVTGQSMSVAMPALPPGTHTLTLTYSGDDAHAPAAGTTTVRVGTAATGLLYAQPNNTNLTLDLSVPSNSTGPWPVIFVIETDDWSALPKTSTVASRELQRGWAIVTARYRTEFPAQIRDLKAALRWLRANATRFNIQPNRIVAWGVGPAGGHLASLLGTSNGVADLDDTSEGVPDGSSRVQGVVDWSGADDLTSFGSCGTAARSAATALGSAAAPAQYASSDDPPFLLMHGASDCTVSSAAPTALANTLRAAGVDVSLQVLDGLAGNGSGWELSAIGKIVDDFLDLKTKVLTSRRRAVRP